MANVVVLGAGLGGTLMAYELFPQLRTEDQLALIGQGPRFHFVPSNLGLPSAGAPEATLRSISAKWPHASISAICSKVPNGFLRRTSGSN